MPRVTSKSAPDVKLQAPKGRKRYRTYKEVERSVKTLQKELGLVMWDITPMVIAEKHWKAADWVGAYIEVNHVYKQANVYIHKSQLKLSEKSFRGLLKHELCHIIASYPNEEHRVEHIRNLTDGMMDEIKKLRRGRRKNA